MGIQTTNLKVNGKAMHPKYQRSATGEILEYLTAATWTLVPANFCLMGNTRRMVGKATRSNGYKMKKGKRQMLLKVQSGGNKKQP